MKNHYLKIILLLIALYSTVSAISIEVIDNTRGNNLISYQLIQNIVNTALNSEINAAPYYEAKVKIYNTPDRLNNYLVIFLNRSDIYFFKSFRIDIKNSVVSKVIENYIETETDAEYGDVCGTCPNPEVEVIVAWIDQFPTSISNGQKTVTALRSFGVKVDTLRDKKESLSAIKNYLTCPKLKMWMRIGHGNKNVVQLGSGESFVSTSAPAQVIKNKIFIFNSCLSNLELGPAMVTNGAYFFASGNIELSTGKEQLITYFVNHAVKNKEELDKSMEAAVKEASYPNAWGWEGNNNLKPWLYEKANNQTNISSNKTILHTYTFNVSVTPNKVVFNNVGSGTVAIYNLSGKLLFEKTGATEWNLICASNQKAVAGSYIAACSNSENNNKTYQTFTITK